MSAKTKKTKHKLLALQAGGFLCSAAPLCAVIGTHLDRYVGTAQAGIKLGIGGGIVLILLFFKSIGRLRIPSRLFASALACLLAWLLAALIADLLLLLTAYFAGDLAEALFFAFPIKRAKENLALGKTADATAGAVENVLRNWNGRC